MTTTDGKAMQLSALVTVKYLFDESVLDAPFSIASKKTRKSIVDFKQLKTSILLYFITLRIIK